MKTETKIAEENIKDYRRVEKEELEISPLHYLGLCNFHKASCQRFLEFLEDKEKVIDNFETEMTSGFGQNYYDISLSKKITDLKNAIKKYDEAEI